MLRMCSGYWKKNQTLHMLLDGFGSNIFLLVSKKPCLCLFTWWEAHIVLLVPNKFVWLCLLSLFVTLYSIIQAYPELRKAKFGVLSAHTGVFPASLVYNLGSQHHQAENEDFAQNVVFPLGLLFMMLRDSFMYLRDQALSHYRLRPYNYLKAL